jgi:hypothetical protein
MTTPVFSTPLIAELHPETLPMLRGANLSMIVNRQVHCFPKTTPLETLAPLISRIGAGLTLKVREATAQTIATSQQRDIHFVMTPIPVGHPETSFIDFGRANMCALFDYVANCAGQGKPRVTPEQGLRRNPLAHGMPLKGLPSCSTEEPAITPGALTCSAAAIAPGFVGLEMRIGRTQHRQ